MKMITEAIERVFEREGVSEIPDFHVLFNDQMANDFNALFNFLPPQRKYYAAGVPGSFHSRLLPKASIHFAYSSCAVNWLSEVPKEVADNESSSAWNKGKIHYAGARKEVLEAYSNQYAKDIQSFLEARAEEIVGGGLMALLVPAEPSFKTSETEFTTPNELNLLGSCLVDMAHKGMLSEEKVDSFNFPVYLTTQQELKALIERNDSFSIERMEVMDNPGKLTMTTAAARAGFLRAGSHLLLANHFGSEIIDELFDRYKQKLEKYSYFVNPENDKSIIICVILKRMK